MAVKKQKMITGRRKKSVARISITPGSGKIKCNGTDYKSYFKRATIAAMVEKPFDAINKTGQYNVTANLSGGGLTGQAGALRYAVSRALVDMVPDSRKKLKIRGFLTRDSRVVQRKMYGHKKARKSFQFSKR
ncbi:MAG TPA: 30S ribosomal protein S9 [Spirochaetota bacterium]|nr:30S ribosomal protein S9 [Spirochaetota bacterium]